MPEPMMMNPVMVDPMQGNKKVTNLTNYKIVKCKNFDREGTCKYGNTCTFAHGETELRTKVENSMLIQTGGNTNPNPQFMFNPYMMDPNMMMQMQYGMNVPMDMSQQQFPGMESGFNLNPNMQFQDPNYMYYQNYPNQNN